MTVNDMRACGWLRGMKVLKAVEVKALPIGMKVYLIGSDRHGEKSFEEGVIEQIGNVRSKRFRVETMDGIARKMIRDYPGKVWAMEDV